MNDSRMVYFALSGLLAISMALAGYAWGMNVYGERLARMEERNTAIDWRLSRLESRSAAIEQQLYEIDRKLVALTRMSQ